MDNKNDFKPYVPAEKITPEIQNAICSCYDKLPDLFNEVIAYYQDAKAEYQK